ncbi:purine nucleoside permease [Paraburkholderia youngii]
MRNRAFGAAISSLLLAGAAALPAIAHADDGFAQDDGASHGRPVKVMIISMFGPEGQVWLDHLGPWQDIPVAGLSPDYPAVHCNRQEVCVMTTGMGHANAAASIMALTFSPRFDLRHTYFMVAGIAGIDPLQGTVGSAAWANWLVDFGIQWEIDGREIPPGLEHRLSRHQHDGPDAEAAARLSQRSVPAQSGAFERGIRAVAQRDAHR